MANFNIDRLKFRWRGEWSTNVEYTKDDIVYYKGKAYVCKKSHTPSNSFYQDRDATELLPVINVTVSNDTINNQAQGVFYLNGVESPALTLLRGRTYTINQDADTNITFNEQSHPLIISSIKDGLFNGGTYFTPGITYNLDSVDVSPQDYVTGFAAATVRRISFIVPASNEITQFNNVLYNIPSSGNNTIGILSTALSALSNGLTLPDAPNLETLLNSVNTRTGNAYGNLAGLGSIEANSVEAATAIEQSGVDYTAEELAAYNDIVNYINSNLEEFVNETVVYNDSGTPVIMPVIYTTGDSVEPGAKLFYASANNPKMGNHFDIAYQTLWEKMFDGNEWKGDWTAANFYSEGDIVKFKGYLYQCKTQHQSLAVTPIGLPGDASKWILYSIGNNWLNQWTVSTNFDLGDVVIYAGTLYICNTKHTSTSVLADGLENDLSKWSIINRSQLWRGDWQISTRYMLDDVVKYGSNVYICNTPHTSTDEVSLGLELNIAAWDILNSGIEYKGNWTGLFRYKENDIVKYGGMLWKANAYHTSTTSLRVDLSYWDVYIPGTEYELVWDSETEYNKGDIVRYGGYTYTALTNNLGSQPSQNGLLQDTGDWEVLNRSYRFLQDWSSGTTYRPGDAVRHGGYLYVSLVDNTNVIPDTDENTWELDVDGIEYKGDWQDNFDYKLGDIVMWAGTAYQCIARHTSTASDSRPDIDIQQDDQDYWVVLIQGSGNSVLAQRGDIRTHDVDEIIRQPIGDPGRVAKVAPLTDYSWGTYEEISNVFYVSPEGIDSAASGKSLGAPFRTVKYACDHINNNLSINKLNLLKYQNTTNSLFTMLSTAILNHFVGTLSATAPTLDAALQVTNPRTGVEYGDIDDSGNVDTQDSVRQLLVNLGQGTAGAETVRRYNELITYLESRVDDFVGETVSVNNYSSGSVPVVYTTHPNTTLFIKTGFYEEQLPIKIPRNCALVGDELRSTTISPAIGYETSDMFYVNNGSGIRNMTLQGLNGTLGDLNTYLTRRPTAGAYVSLDPGTGPNDNTVWILNKSPYVQNVTTFGTGCIGMKIDGALHDDGNDSIVANDFTQVLDDGIGYWATNGGRSELVSVFTYFCHIGYLAENGGILRATNGNNSYGEFGSVAEGVNATETPITGAINNRSNQATVDEIFTYGTVAQQILALGYSNAGQNYDSASVTFSGAGIDAAGSYTETRNNAISDIRIEALGDSSIPGGLNYTFVSNNAQAGDTTQITIASSDIADDVAYIGQRIVITAGKGVGQFATITAYNSTTKIAIVSKESNGDNGWDHFQPGWPIEATLDETTVYTIEPTVTVEEPTFGASANTNLSGSDINPDYIASGGGSYLITGIDLDGTGSNYYLSTNGGQTWTNELNGPTSATDITQTAWSGSVFVSLPLGSVDIYVKMQPDGTYAFDTSTTLNVPSKVLFSDGNGYVYHIGNTASLGDFVASVSTNNGDSWTNSSAILGTLASQEDNFNYFQAGAASTYGTAVILASDGLIGLSTNFGSTWTTSTPLSAGTWTDLAYGNGRWIAVGTVSGETTFARSFDGVTWYEETVTTPTPFTCIEYGEGTFMSFGQSTIDDENRIGFSAGGDTWSLVDSDSTAFGFHNLGNWSDAAYGSDGWIAIENLTTNLSQIDYGATAILRAKVTNSRIESVLVYDPGSNYTGAPTVTIFDNENTVDALISVNINDKVLAQPEMSNRGSGYVTAAATITGDGFADTFQTGLSLVLSNVSRIPGPGDNLEITGISDIVYRVVRVDEQSGVGPYGLTITISPSIGVEESPSHGETITIRQQYSQVRLTGHDFLDIGTGNVNSTRYPNLYLEGQDSLNAAQPFNETVAKGGGRVFYTSTDQDGNFRAGELFAVEQATGIVTINASQFDLSGLTELSIGGVQVGGSEVVIREFSKDPTFVADSNNIVPTQAAIKTYLEGRISGGGSNANTNRLVAGQVQIDTGRITTTSGLQINMNQKTNLKKGADGHYLASLYYGVGG